MTVLDDEGARIKISAKQLEAEFQEQFWAAYPLNESRKQALQKYEKARQMAPLPEILIGLEAYKRCKPSWKNWKQASGWLNGEKWKDGYTPEEAGSGSCQKPNFYVYEEPEDRGYEGDSCDIFAK